MHVHYSNSYSLGKKLCILGALVPCLASARIHEFETTRLKSTAGAGAGSLLVEEATVLNPASLSFFGLTSIFLQKAGIDKTQSMEGGDVSTENDQMAVILSDSNPNVSGSVSYVNQSEGHDKRKRFSLAMASPLGGNSSFGVAYKMTKDSLSDDGYEYRQDNYNQFVAGFTHALNTSLSFGLSVVDPLRKRPQDTRAVMGLHYTYEEFIGLMLDTGADYNRGISETLLYKAATQIRVYEDFYIRVGTFNDKGLREKGNGAGIGWVQPKLDLEVAIKDSKVSENTELRQRNARIKETSFSLSYRF